MAALLVASTAWAGTPRVMPRISHAPHSWSKAVPTEQRLGARKGLATTDVLISEDFSKMTAGTIDEPDEQMIASFGDNEWGASEFIDAQYTHKAGWSGHNVYQAGGAVAVMNQGGASHATLNTPIGDYSGDLVVKFKVRDINPNGNSYVFVSVCTNGIYYPNAAQLSEEVPVGGYHITLKGDDWTEGTLTVRNYSSNNDGFIQFDAYGQIELDDIEVTASVDDFIAQPIVLPETNFTVNSFTINWEPVRKALDYRVWLYREVQLTEGDVTYNYTFEDGMPQDCNISEGAQIAEGEGFEGSNGLKLYNGDYIMTNDLGYLRNISLWMSAVYGDNDPEGGLVSVLFGSNGDWEELGQYDAEWFTEGGAPINLDEEFGYYGLDIANKYKAFGLKVSDMPEGAYVVVDNIDFTSGPLTKLEFAGNKRYSDDKWNYTMVQGLSHTFTDLDPEGEYFYKVAAHWGAQVSESPFYHALGLSTPVTLEATNIDPRGSYTANWEETPKAEYYTVNNYGVTVAQSNGSVVLLDEDFSKITSDVTSSTDANNPQILDNYQTVISLDEYTLQPGWTGIGNTISENSFGFTESFYQQNYVCTPSIYALNDETVSLSVSASGSYGDYLVVQTPNSSYMLPFNSRGMLNAQFDITTPFFGPVKFLSYNGYAAMLYGVTVAQEVEAGEKVFTFLGSDETPELEYTFTGLGNYDYDNFAYGVVAHYIYSGGTQVDSAEGGLQLVNPDSAGVDSASLSEMGNSQRTVVGIYSVDGRQVTGLQQGVNIVRYSDGTTVKIMK